MKFRATTNSIRIRVRKSDLQQLATQGEVREEVSFPGAAHWAFALVIDADTTTARFEQGTITVQLAKAEADAWINSQQVGIERQLPLPEGQSLHLLLEKDFPCKTREEDVADTFFELEEGGC